MPGIMDPLGQVAQILGVHRTVATSNTASSSAVEKKASRGDASLVDVSHSGSALAAMASRLREVGFVHDPNGANHEDHQKHREHEPRDGRRLKEFRESDDDKAARHERIKEVTDEENEEIRRLKETDAKVKTHEMAHKVAAGSLAAGGPYYDYEQGPDGVSYAVSGRVPIRLPETSDPEQALRDSEQAYRAALAPADPSSADRAAAAEFSSRASQARQEIAKARSDEAGLEPQGDLADVVDNPIGGESTPLDEAAETSSGESSTTTVQAHLHPEFLLG